MLLKIPKRKGEKIKYANLNELELLLGKAGDLWWQMEVDETFKAADHSTSQSRALGACL